MEEVKASLKEVKASLPQDSVAAKNHRHWVAPRSNKRIGVWLAASSIFAAVMFQEEISHLYASFTRQSESNTEEKHS